MQTMYRNILLVEDDVDDKALFFYALEKIDNSIRCTWVQNGEEALGYLNAHSHVLPECIFMDWNMPKINGLECY